MRIHLKEIKSSDGNDTEVDQSVDYVLSGLGSIELSKLLLEEVNSKLKESLEFLSIKSRYGLRGSVVFVHEFEVVYPIL